MSKCGTVKEEHCCWLAGTVCPFLRRTSRKVQANDGIYWRCQLRTEHGNWDKVHEDPRYLRVVQPHWDRCGVKDCGYWPQSSGGHSCNICGNGK